MAGFARDIELTRGHVVIEARPDMRIGLRKATMQLQQFAGNLRSMAFAAGAMATGVTLALTPMIRTFVEFDDQLRMLQGVLGVTGREFESLSRRVRELGRETSFTAAQVAEAATNLARAGFTPQQVEDAIGPVLNLSRATGTDLADSARIAANALKTFGLEAEQTENMVDILVNTTNSSNQILTELAEAVAYAGVEAKAANADFGDTAAIIGILADRGLTASRAGTSLRRVYKNLANETKRSKIEELGIPVLDRAGDLRNVVDILDDVGRAMQQMGTGERAALAEQVFGARGADAARIIADNAGAIRTLAQANREAAGTAADLAFFMDAGIGGAFRRLFSQFQEFSIIIGEALAEPLTMLAAGLKVITNQLGRFAKRYPMLIRLIAGFVAVLVAASAALVGLSLVMLAGAKLTAILTSEFALMTAATFGLSAGFTTLTASLVRFLTVLGIVGAIAAPLLALLAIGGIMTLGAPSVIRNRRRGQGQGQDIGAPGILDYLLAPVRAASARRVANAALPEGPAAFAARMVDEEEQRRELGLRPSEPLPEPGLRGPSFAVGGFGGLAANAIQLQPAQAVGDTDTELLAEIADNTGQTARNTNPDSAGDAIYYS